MTDISKSERSDMDVVLQTKAEGLKDALHTVNAWLRFASSCSGESLRLINTDHGGVEIRRDGNNMLIHTGGERVVRYLQLLIGMWPPPEEER